MYFCGQIFNHGVIRWRFKDTVKQIVLMNDYDVETGSFLVSSICLVILFLIKEKRISMSCNPKNVKIVMNSHEKNMMQKIKNLNF